MRLLVAPQEFKGSLTAAEAAAAIAEGIRDVHPSWELDLLPMSDGGPGFVDAFEASLGGERHIVPAHDALLRPLNASILSIPSASGPLVVVEAAAANGLVLIDPAARDALAADTFGVGELLAAAFDLLPATLVIGVGGSATTDGGHGMARALGAQFLDDAGRPLLPGGASLAGLAAVHWQRPPVLERVDVVVAVDVTNPLVGPRGAAAIYGPQKGATAAHVDALDAALTRYAAVVRRQLGVEVATLPGGGAAGGLAAGLVAFLGARLESGFDIVSRVSGLEERFHAADTVVTGEGSFDAQSGEGKTTGRLLAMAKSAEKPAVVFAGVAPAGSVAVTLHTLEPDPAKSMANAAGLLRDLARRWASGSNGTSAV
ncbi:MAG: glycerate kinase [Dehalococcoidia bacterium]|nr:glycerate kinase [Dehalococcoidia bacterium]MCB9486580.1 glycerate kinase [Thermoflexaceae bacterium]